MQYTITINQRSVIENGWDLSFDDMAVFSFMKNFILEGALSKHVIHGKDYFWISFSKIREQLPMLSGNSDSSIRRHISNLVRVGLIEKCEDEISIKNRISLYRLGKSFPKYWHCNNPSKNDDTPPNLEGYPSKNERVTPPNLEGDQYTNISDNQDQYISPNGELRQAVSDKPKKKKSFAKETSLQTKAKEVFLECLASRTSEDVAKSYYYDGKNAGKLNSLLKKIKFDLKQKFNRDKFTDEEVLKSFRAFLNCINDGWIENNFDIPTIDSRYNAIRIGIKNRSKSSKPDEVGRMLKFEDEEEKECYLKRLQQNILT